MRLGHILGAVVLAVGLFLGQTALAGGCGDAHAKNYHHENDIVAVATDAGSFNTLLAAAEAAGLVETLKGEGPYTVFAPNDEAFAKIPQEQLDALLGDKEKLAAVLTYHVVPGRVTAADVVKLDSAKTVQGQSLTIVAGEAVTVDGARVVQTDIPASNGVIHVIDTVVLPEA